MGGPTSSVSSSSSATGLATTAAFFLVLATMEELWVVKLLSLETRIKKREEGKNQGWG